MARSKAPSPDPPSTASSSPTTLTPPSSPSTASWSSLTPPSSNHSPVNLVQSISDIQIAVQKCDYCCEYPPDKEERDRHMDIVHGIPPTDPEGEPFTSRYPLDASGRLMLPVPKKPPVAKFWDKEGRDAMYLYQKTLRKYNICGQCMLLFKRPWFLAVHKHEVHGLPHPDIKLAVPRRCLAGCEQHIAGWDSMIYHLEQGECEPGINLLDLNQMAASPHYTIWTIYLKAGYHPELQSRIDVASLIDGGLMQVMRRPYKRPECGKQVVDLSDLFLHVVMGDSQGRYKDCGATIDSEGISDLKKVLYDGIIFWRREKKVEMLSA